MQMARLLLCMWPSGSKKKWLWILIGKLRLKLRAEPRAKPRSRTKPRLELYYLTMPPLSVGGVT